jgi:hypothetical protein
MADVYKIGVEIALVGTIMQGLEAISAKLLGINTRVKDVEGGFARWGLAIGGAAALFGAEKIAVGMERAVKAGGELVKQQTLLQNLIQNPGEVSATTTSAQAATLQIMGTTIAENIKGMREMVGVTNSMEEARKLYVPTMQGAKILESLTGTPAEKSLQTLAKAIEQLGGGTNPKTQEVDPQRFEQYMREAVKTIVASGGLIDANTLLGFAKQAGPMARMTQDPATLFQSYMTAMMDMGGYRAGTALTAAGRQLLGGKMGKSTAEEMENMGLLKPGMWHKSGTGVKVDEGGLVGEEMLKGADADVAKWFNQVFKKALADHGKTDPSDINQELYKVLGTETMRRIAGLFLQNSGQIERDANLQKGAADVDTAYGNIKAGDYEANVKNVETAWESLMQAFGAPMVATAIQGMQMVANAINSLAGGALAHPQAMKVIGEGLIGLAAGLAVLGTVAIGAAMTALVPGGAIAAAVAGLVAVFGTLAAFNWSSVSNFGSKMTGDVSRIFGDMWKSIYIGLSAPSKDVLAKVGAAFDDIGPAILRFWNDAFLGLPAKMGTVIAGVASSIGSALSAAIASIPGMVMGAIGGMASGIGAAIGAKIKSLGGFLGGGAAGGLHDPTSSGEFTPGAYHPSGGSNVTVHTTTALNVDGKKVAQIVSRQIASLGTHPRQASNYDSGHGYATQDYGYATS